MEDAQDGESRPTKRSKAALQNDVLDSQIEESKKPRKRKSLLKIPQDVIVAARQAVIHSLAGGALARAEVEEKLGDIVESELLSSLLDSVAEENEAKPGEEKTLSLVARVDVWGEVDANDASFGEIQRRHIREMQQKLGLNVKENDIEKDKKVPLDLIAARKRYEELRQELRIVKESFQSMHTFLTRNPEHESAIQVAQEALQRRQESQPRLRALLDEAAALRALLE